MFVLSGVIGSPSVNLFIDPLGGVRLISSHEQIFCPPYRAVGSSFPQSSVPALPLTQAALAVGRACYNASKPLLLLMHRAAEYRQMALVDNRLQ